MNHPGFFDKVIRKIDSIDRSRLERLLVAIEGERKSLDLILSTIKEGILVVHPDGELFYHNRIAETLLSIGKKDRHLDDLELDERLADTILNRLGSPSDEPRELMISTPFQRVLQVKSFVSEKGADHVAKTIFVIEDITQTRINDVKLQKAQHLASLSTISSGILHEIKNPLTAMDLHLQLLQRELKSCPLENDGITDSLTVLGTEIDRLKKILDRFRKAVRSTAPRLAPVELSTLLRQTINTLQHELEEAGIAVRWNLPAQLSTVQGDEELLTQAFMNIVKNAMEAMERNGTITITITEDQDFIQIDFHDTGPGLSEEALDNLFEPYFSTKDSGMGLGLSIVYRIIVDHNGMIDTYNNADGSGATCQIVLPIYQKKPKLIK